MGGTVPEEIGSSSSDSSSVSSSDSDSSEAKKKKEKKKIKKAKKLLKKLKKAEKKAKKKEKKLAKKAKKDGKREKKHLRDGQEGGQEDASGAAREEKRASRATEGPSCTPAAGRPRAAEGGSLLTADAPFECSLLDVCERAARGMNSTSATIQDERIISVYSPEGDLIESPKVFKTFKEIREFPRPVQQAFQDTGFPGPSQIQAYCWPLGLRGKDVIGIAATGSGKTLAFLMPAFVEMHEQGARPERDGPGLLVMSPTRELAQQTEAEGNKFGKCLQMRCVAMYGGAPKGSQMSRYRQGCACVVACPGRLNDFLEGRQVQLRNTRRLVLDEADRMLDMGFEPQIRKILEHLPSKRQTLFFTATWPREIQSLASEILTKPYKVMVGDRDELKGNADVTQLVRIVPANRKLDMLAEILMEAGLNVRGGLGKGLIFCGSKRMCDQLSASLERSGVPCAAIHGDKDQQQRDAALSDLKQGRIKVLVGTDVAARGLDIKGVGLVVNFDPPNNAEDYVHRIGRTGRAGAKGVAIALLTPDEGGKARNILEVMERTGQAPPPELRRLAEAAGSSRGKGGGRGGTGARGRSRSRSR
ncbi:unnamed protein product [Prorocentrum cordatum]|uniref:RNA helicase n=1 Tax=Prorocentrum cordatum TaxID=2364126 RepID=A0ABN9TSI8_9DINO|nr:unnamed protein product [Polarella glacialis]